MAEDVQASLSNTPNRMVAAAAMALRTTPSVAPAQRISTTGINAQGPWGFRRGTYHAGSWISTHPSHAIAPNTSGSVPPQRRPFPARHHGHR